MLAMIVRRIGEPKASLADSFVQNSVYSYYGAPILGTIGNVIAYSRRRRASTPSILVNWSTGIRAFVSRSATTYFTTSAVGGGRIYLSSANCGEFNALDEAIGRVLGGWALPSRE
ncbi:hypothetical protein [Sphingomonas faeni]|uniref:hypothetical protein n=1 Tax=Sphingomonas faeni TaxID=185950 RepID=UPI002781CE68|nr:hypothetical protein [Sphingomonas faeni]MDQ0839775.1 hypothetical protein [Sphingomonas faeni]